jgi:predicted phage terminase large subunit-like protein
MPAPAPRKPEQVQPISLEAYWKARNPRYQYARHIALIVETLEGLEPGDCLILNMPPRAGKTETLMTFLEHRLGTIPTDELMYISYSGALAFQKSRRMRNEVRSGNAFRTVFPHVALAQDAKKVSEWRLESGGGLIASGVGGSLTGKGARIAAIDDPIKGRKSAESKLIRDSTIEFLAADVITRLEPDGILILTQTRWHANDPSAWLEELFADAENPLEGFRLKRLVIPAIAEHDQLEIDPLEREPGESFWPERWDTQKLLRNRRVLGEYDFAALYQQRPYLRGGNVFNDTPARYEVHDPNGWRISIVCDLAASTKKTADYTVFEVAAHQGLGEERIMRVLEIKRGHWAIDTIAQVALDLQVRYGQVIAFEQVAAQIAVVDHLRSRGVRLRTINPSKLGDKFARAAPAAAAWNAARIELPMVAPWLDDFLLEHTSFTGTPADEHDDQVDCTAYNWLEGNRSSAWSTKSSTAG